MSGLADTACGADDLPIPWEKGDPEARDKLADTLERIGADKTCKQAAMNAFDNYATSGSFSGDAEAGPYGFLGSADMDGNFQTSGSSTESNTMNEGCTQLALSAANTITSARSISCSVQNASTDSAGTMRNNAKVSVKIDSDGCLVLAKYRRDLLTLMADNAKTIAQTQPALAAKIMMSFDKLAAKTLCSITMVGSQLRASVTAQLRTSNKSTLTNHSTLSTQIEEMVVQEAQNSMEADLGGLTNVPDLKQIISSTFSSTRDDTVTNVINNASQTSTNLTSTGEVEIVSPENIVLKDTVVDANIDARSKAEAIMSASTEAGVTLATKVMSDASSGNVAHMSTEQLKGIVEAMGNANAAAIKTQMDGHVDAIGAGKERSVVEMVITAVVIMAVVRALRPGGGGYEGGPPAYNPALCVGYKTFPEQFGRYFKIVGTISMLIKIHFLLFVFRQFGKLMAHSTMLLTPWDWGKLNVGQYFMNVIWSWVAFKIYCSFLHGTSGLGECFSLVHQRADPNFCTLGPDRGGGDDDGFADDDDYESVSESDDE